MSSAYQVQVSYEKMEDPLRVNICQSLTHVDGQDLCQWLKESILQGRKQSDINLCNLKFCDSETIGVFVMMNKTVQQFAGGIRFIVPKSSPIYSLLQMCRLDRILSIAEPCTM